MWKCLEVISRNDRVSQMFREYVSENIALLDMNIAYL